MTTQHIFFRPVLLTVPHIQYPSPNQKNHLSLADTQRVRTPSMLTFYHKDAASFTFIKRPGGQTNESKVTEIGVCPFVIWSVMHHAEYHSSTEYSSAKRIKTEFEEG